MQIEANQASQNGDEGAVSIPSSGSKAEMMAAVIKNVRWQIANDKKSTGLKKYTIFIVFILFYLFILFLSLMSVAHDTKYCNIDVYLLSNIASKVICGGLDTKLKNSKVKVLVSLRLSRS